MIKYTMQFNNKTVRDEFLEKMKSTHIDTITLFAAEHNKDSLDGSIWTKNSKNEIEQNFYWPFQLTEDTQRGEFHHDPQNDIYWSKSADPIVELINTFGNGIEEFNQKADDTYLVKFEINSSQRKLGGYIQCRQDLHDAIELFLRMYVATRGEAEFRFTND